MRLENQTPFALAHVILLDKAGAEVLTVVLKATYSIGENGGLQIAEKQDPVHPADQFHGEPGMSSIRYEAELSPPKLTTDVILHGSAVPGRPDTVKMEVALRVGPVSQRAIVFGERHWKKSLLGLTMSRPQPIERIPLIYENAYGGADSSAANPKHHDHEASNPVGRGFRAKKSQLDLTDVPLPNIENPDRLLREPGVAGPPVGFGFIGRDWQPRVNYVGTYDQQWQEERMPLLPLNFDEKYYSAAHPNLVAPAHLTGGESVEVVGCTRPGRLAFSLPALSPVFSVHPGLTPTPVAMKLNTVLVDTEALKLNLLWKGSLNVHRRLMSIREIACQIPGARL